MRRFQAPNPPFVEANLVGPKQKPTAIVLNLSGTTSDKGAALGIATQLHQRTSPSVSHHFLVDEAEIYRGAWDDTAVFANPHGSLSVLICAQPHEDAAMWNYNSAESTLVRTAELVGDLCLAYRIPPRYLENELFSRWEARRVRRRGGIISRIPGEWPSEAFLENVRSQISRKKGQNG